QVLGYFTVIFPNILVGALTGARASTCAPADTAAGSWLPARAPVRSLVSTLACSSMCSLTSPSPVGCAASRGDNPPWGRCRFRSSALGIEQSQRGGDYDAIRFLRRRPAGTRNWLDLHFPAFHPSLQRRRRWNGVVRPALIGGVVVNAAQHVVPEAAEGLQILDLGVSGRVRGDSSSAGFFLESAQGLLDIFWKSRGPADKPRREKDREIVPTVSFWTSSLIRICSHETKSGSQTQPYWPHLQSSDFAPRAPRRVSAGARHAQLPSLLPPCGTRGV
ncbi:MAG: hypothetical protein BJ554DRAFT_8140, partial [Olpidium bornovanus]